MKKYVVISHNGDKKYSFFEQIVSELWYDIGYQPICRQQNSPVGSQLVRLFHFYDNYANYFFKDDDYILTSDVDMLPLSKSYFNQQNWSKPIHLFGMDLCDYKVQPICYIGMTVKKWREVINEDYEKVLDEKPEDSHELWNYDQTYFWKKINEYGLVDNKDIQIIPRGVMPNGLPKGRIDRSAWDYTYRTIIEEKQYEPIDCHMLRPGYTDENFGKMIDVIKNCFPTIDLTKFYEYRDRFIKQTA